MYQAMVLNDLADVPSGPPAQLDLARLVHPSDWARLPPSLRRRFAVGHGTATYAGAIECAVSPVGRVFAWLAGILGAPLPRRTSAAAPMIVTVAAKPGGIVWSRQMGTTLVRSVKSHGPGGTVLEQTDGGLGMVLALSIDDGALVFTSRSFFWALGPWRVPVPALLTPGQCRVEHRAVSDGQFRFTLSMTHPVWGQTFYQTGLFNDAPECPQ